MKRSIEVLKKHGVIEKMQDSFNRVKPPKGISDETIHNTIAENIHLTIVLKEESVVDELFDAMIEDLAECTRNELQIEYCEEFKPISLLADIFRDIANTLENGGEE